MTPTSATRAREARTRPGVERTIVWGFLGIRAFDLGQALVAMSTGSLRASTAPAVDLAVFGAVCAESALLAVWLVRRGSPLPLRWPFWADFGLALLAIASALVFLEPAARTNVWAMWPYAVTLSSTVLIGGTLGRCRDVLFASGLLAVTYAAVDAVPRVGHPFDQATGVANALAYPGFAMVSYLFMRFVRQLADTADQAEARVISVTMVRWPMRSGRSVGPGTSSRPPCTTRCASWSKGAAVYASPSRWKRRWRCSTEA